MAKSVFFSFHYQRDAWRVQQVMNMGALEKEKLLTPQQWEAVKQEGDAAIERWIARQMARKSALVVLIGAQTASRPWVKYEIAYAWNNKKPLMGIHIHGLKDRLGVTDSMGENPFSNVTLKGGGNVGQFVPVHNPVGATSDAVYRNIDANLKEWVESAYRPR